MDEPCLPSPLCEKEINDLYQSVISSPMKPERDTNVGSSSAEIENAIDAALSSSVNLDRLAEKSNYIVSENPTTQYFCSFYVLCYQSRYLFACLISSFLTGFAVERAERDDITEF